MKFNITNIPEVTVSTLSPTTAIVNVRYNTRYELCSSFMRIQEFYESDIPCIQGNLFTLETYMDEYAKKNGGFSYTMDWSGFNIPSKAFYDFYVLYRNTFLEKEKMLFNSIEFALGQSSGNVIPSKLYIIGSYKECAREASVIQHEIAHALYTLDSDYKCCVDVICNALPYRAEIIKVLKEWGYSDSVIDDEVQAYASTNCSADWTSFTEVNTKDSFFKELIKSLNECFKITCKKHGIPVPKAHTNKVRIQLETEYKAKYGYNAGEMI